MSATEDPQALLYAAISRAQAKVKPAQKSGHNSHNKYDYADATDLRNAIAVMWEEGLSLVPGTITHRETSTIEKDRGNRGKGIETRVYIEQTWTITHGAGGRHEFTAIGEGRDHGDKAAYKAHTGAQKYAMRLAFLVPMREDPEKTPNQSPAQDLAVAFREGKAAALAELIRQPPVGNYTESGFRKQLDMAGAKVSVWEVSMFCAWKGWPAPHAMQPNQRDNLPGWLVGKGQEDWKRFQQAFAPADQD